MKKPHRKTKVTWFDLYKKKKRKALRMLNSIIKKCLFFIRPNYVLASVDFGRLQQNAKQLNASFLLQNAFSFPQTKEIQDLKCSQSNSEKLWRIIKSITFHTELDEQIWLVDFEVVEALFILYPLHWVLTLKSQMFFGSSYEKRTWLPR